MSHNEMLTDPNPEDGEIVMGIDLGTRFSCVSIWRNHKPEIICDQYGNRTIPSVVAFYKSAKLVGHNALSLKDVNAKNTIYDVKRIIGRRMNDPVIEQVKELISYQIIDDETPHHNILIQLDMDDPTISRKRTYKPEEICAYILLEIKKMVSQYLKPEITKAVITVPAYFSDAQRHATLDASRIAGLDVIKIINEPTAAAIAYGMGTKTNGNIIVYDLGAGTLDVSLMRVSSGEFRTLAVSGNCHLGGEDIDYLIMSHVMIQFQKQHQIKDLKITKFSQLRLKNAVENAKKILSSTDQAIICVDDFYQNKKLYHLLSRDTLEAICHDLFIMCLKPLKDVLESSGIDRKDIDEVILVGGSSRIPKIQKLILDFFRNTPVKQLTMSLNPDEVVSIGASIYGYVMTHQDDPFSQNLVLLDITPLSLGVETLQKQMTVIIPRNTVIPTTKTKTFTTDTDDQDSVSIKIFEGERKLTKDNFRIGTFDLSGFDKGPRGYPIIKITFHIDINGILQVTAYEKKSNVQNGLKITSTWGAKGRMSRKEIDDLIMEAEKNEQVDQVYSTKIGLHHRLSSICDAILINLKDDSFNLTKLDKKKIEIDIKNIRQWLDGKDISELKIDELESKIQRLSNIYTPLIALPNKAESQFREYTTPSHHAGIEGDDEEMEDETFQKVDLLTDPSEYDKGEIKELKKIISELGKNILSIVNNPVSKLSKEDSEIINDYIGSVNIWLYTTNASTSMEYLAKIKEINQFTEDILKKYEETAIFESDDIFATKDELYLTCLTLYSSLRSTFFSLKESDVDKLSKKIDETMAWLTSHQNEESTTYQDKLNEINDLCNIIYHNTHKIKALEEVPDENLSEDLSDHEDASAEIAPELKINEPIDLLLVSLPDRLTRSSAASSNNDVLMKIDIDKLSTGAAIRYKNVSH